MTKQTIKLDEHRGMVAPKATELRLLPSDVEIDEKMLRQRQSASQDQPLAAPAPAWEEAAAQARYVLALFAGSSGAQDPRHQMPIASPRADPPSQSTERNISCKS